MALAIYEGTKDDQQVGENIDEEILRLLGLEDVSDLDYDEYKTLLKERMAAGRMPGSDIPTEDTEKLTEEFKRVKKETGKFKVKNNKIKFNSVVKTAQESKPRSASTPTKKLMGSKVEPEKETEVVSEPQDMMGFLTSTLAPSLSNIEASLANIFSNLSSQQQAEDKAAAKNRIGSEKAKNRNKEQKQESGKDPLGKLGNVGKKVLSPMSDIFSTIFKFLKNIALGMLVLKVLDILKDPGKFFRNIGNSIIDFFNGFLKGIFNIIFFPMNSFINLLNGAVNEFEFAINNTIGKIPGIPDLKLPDIPNIEAPQIPKIKAPEQKTEQPKDAGAKAPVPAMKGGGEVTNVTNKYYQLMEGGGKVRTDSGEKVTGAGPDTQLVALQPGEVVMSRPAVDAYGADTLLGMNAAAGGTNSPKMARVQSASGGGMIPAMSGGGIVEYITGDRSHSGYAADHGGGNYHEHIAFNSIEKRDSAVDYLKSKGITIGSMNDGKHAVNSYHYVDQAFDVPLYPNIQNFGIPDNREGEERFSAKVRQLLSSGGFTGAGVGGGGSSDKTKVDPQETVTGKSKPSSGGGGGSSKGRWGPLLDLIAEGESDTSGGYDAMNPGRNTKAEGKPITQMTMKQVRDMAMSSTKGTGAAGRYQIMPVYNGVNVFKQLVESVGLNYETDLFSPANQDKMGIYRLAVTRGGNDWLSGKMSDEAFGKGISYEWAALKSKSGGAYDGDGRNKSTIGYNKVLEALGQVKSGKGVSTEDLNTPNMTPGSSESPSPVASSSPTFTFAALSEKEGTPGANNRSSGPSTSDLSIPSMTSGSSSAPIVSPTIKSSSMNNIPPPRSRTGSGGIIPLPIPGQKQQTSSSGGNQTEAPLFPSTDQNNPELLVVKSIYNII